MELRNLRSLVALAELGSIRRTAEQLNLSPAAIHTQLKVLESAMGVQLYEKAGRQLRLTQVAEGISTDVQSAPPPAVGGVIIPQNILMATISDNSYGGIERQLVLDTMNMIVGACEAHVEMEWDRLKITLNWFKEG